VFAQENQNIITVLRQGMNIVFNTEKLYSFKDENLYLQNGSQRDKKNLDKNAPNCQVRFDAKIKEGLKGALILSGQEYLAFNLAEKSSSGSIFGFDLNKYNFEISFNGIIADGKKAGLTEQKMIEFAETDAGFQKVYLKCSGFKIEPTLLEFQKVVGDNLFTIRTNTEKTQHNDVLKLSPTFKIYQAERIAKEKAYEAAQKESETKRLNEEAAKKLAAEEEVKRKQEIYLKSLGDEILEDKDMTVITKNTAIILGTGKKTPTDLSKYTSYIYQDGLLAGAADQKNLYSVKSKELDKERPYCLIAGTERMQMKNSQEVGLLQGAFKTIKAQINVEKNTAILEANFMVKIEEEGVTKLWMECFNVRTIDNFKSALGPETRLFIKNDDQKNTDDSENSSNPFQESPISENVGKSDNSVQK
jgi:hypothetical protein